MKIFTVLCPDRECDDPDFIPVMIDLSPSHIDMITKAQDAARQLKGLVNIALRLSGPEFSRPKITFLEGDFQEKSWAEYGSMLGKVTFWGDLPETKFSIGVSYVDSYGHIEERFIYESTYDNFIPTAEYLINDDFFDYIQDADNLLELKQYVSEKDYEFLVKESDIDEEKLQKNIENIRRQYEG